MAFFRKTAAALLVLALSLFLAASALADGAIVDPYTLYTYDKMVADIAALEARYPELISSCVIGQTVEGRDIPCFSLGKGKKEIIICASLHGREYISTNFVMYMAEGYAEGYESDGSLNGVSYRSVLDSVRFIIVPMINADGVTLAQQGSGYTNYSLVQSLPIFDNDPSGIFSWKANINGVDLNRNYPYNWAVDGESPVPSSADYSGPYAASEPETRAMLGLVDNSPFYLLCSFHTSGQYVYWIDNSNSSALYDTLRPIAKRIASGIGYKLCGIEDVSDFGGYLVNYARGTYEKPCITVELCPLFGIYPYNNYEKLQKTVEQVYPIGILLAQEALALPDNGNGIDVSVGGKTLLFPDVRPQIINERTLVPVCAVSEGCGISVGWDAESGTITLSKGDTELIMQIGSTLATVNGEETELEVSPVLKNDRTLVPLRGILEYFDYTVGWDAQTRTVLVADAPIMDEPSAAEPEAE